MNIFRGHYSAYHSDFFHIRAKRKLIIIIFFVIYLNVLQFKQYHECVYVQVNLHSRGAELTLEIL